MTIPFKISNTTVLTFDIANQDIKIPRGNVSSTPNKSQASLCSTTQCYNCTEVQCADIKCNEVRCAEVKCSNCSYIECASKCDCCSDS